MDQQKRIVPNSIKSIGIIFYLLFVVFAALVNWMHYPWAPLLHPWFHYKMFSGGKTQHIELAIEKITADNIHIAISMNDLFPMPHAWIERGDGLAISSMISSVKKQPIRNRLSLKLCHYALRKEKEKNMVMPKEIRVYRNMWPISAGKSNITTLLLASCS